MHPISTLTIWTAASFASASSTVAALSRAYCAQRAAGTPATAQRAPWRRKTGKRRSRLRLCARERRRSARERRDARSARRPGHKRPCRNAWVARRGSRHTRLPRQTGAPSVGFDLPETIERSILMQNQEAGIASPQVAATVQSNRQYHQNSEIVQHRPCVTQRQFWRGPPRRNVRAWHPRRQRTLAP